MDFTSSCNSWIWTVCYVTAFWISRNYSPEKSAISSSALSSSLPFPVGCVGNCSPKCCFDVSALSALLSCHTHSHLFCAGMWFFCSSRRILVWNSASESLEKASCSPSAARSACSSSSFSDFLMLLRWEGSSSGAIINQFPGSCV